MLWPLASLTAPRLPLIRVAELAFPLKVPVNVVLLFVSTVIMPLAVPDPWAYK